MIEVLVRLGIKGTYFNIVKGNNYKFIPSINLNGENLKALSQKSDKDKTSTRQGHCLLSQSRKYLRFCWSNNAKEGEQKDINEEEGKVTLFTDMIFCINNARDSTRNLLQLKNTFSKVVVFKKSQHKNQPMIIRLRKKNQGNSIFHNSTPNYTGITTQASETLV